MPRISTHERALMVFSRTSRSVWTICKLFVLIRFRYCRRVVSNTKQSKRTAHYTRTSRFKRQQFEFSFISKIPYQLCTFARTVEYNLRYSATLCRRWFFHSRLSSRPCCTDDYTCLEAKKKKNKNKTTPGLESKEREASVVRRCRRISYPKDPDVSMPRNAPPTSAGVTRSITS